MDKLIQDFISLAIEHGECTFDGNYKKGNKVHGKIIKIIELIKKEEDHVRKEFYDLMNHEDDSVRMWAATTLLKSFEQRALGVLKDVATFNKTIHSLTARTTVDCWQKGLLTNIIDWNSL